MQSKHIAVAYRIGLMSGVLVFLSSNLLASVSVKLNEIMARKLPKRLLWCTLNFDDIKHNSIILYSRTSINSLLLLITIMRLIVATSITV